MPVVAKETVRVAGYVDLVRKNAVYDDNDPVVKARPDLFESADNAALRHQRPKTTADLAHRSMSSRGIEKATAAPGEKRNVRVPKKGAKSSKDEG